MKQMSYMYSSNNWWYDSVQIDDVSAINVAPIESSIEI